MALTRSFKDTVKARAERDPAFRDALLTEAVDQFLAGDLETGKAVLRDYINATIGFERLAEETGSSSKSLMRMLSPTGNPTASNLFSVLSTVQKAAGVHLAVAASRRASAHADEAGKRNPAVHRGSSKILLVSPTQTS